MSDPTILYQDRIFGPAAIDEPVLLNLLDSKAIKRLHGVLQHGITGLLGITRNTTRFEHSMGVFCLARRLGAPLEEQIAALLHDVSHTAFSHVIDYVFNRHDHQSYHEEKKGEFMAASDLPAVLGRHGYDWRVFLDEDQFPLLEQPAPALCADRLDYFLRDALDLKLASFQEIQRALNHLVVHDSRIVVDDLSVARWLGETFIAADQASWANFREVGLYEITAQAIRIGLRLGVIREADIWTTDEALWQKLQRSPDPQLKRQLARISPATRFTWDAERAEFWVSTKLRTIDPEVLLNGKSAALSELEPDFARQRAAYLAENGGQWPFYVEPPL